MFEQETVIESEPVTPTVDTQELPSNGLLDSVTYYGLMAGVEAQRKEMELAVAPTAGTLAYASWVHGVSLTVELPSLLEGQRPYGGFMWVRGKPGTTNWFHFMIPTPVIIANVRYKLDSVMLYFQTGSVVAIVRHVHVYDGPNKLVAYNNVNITGGPVRKSFAVPNRPSMVYGINIAVGVEFLNVSQSRDMYFFAAGADLYQ